MILTSAFLICKALGVSWSWWWIVAAIVGDDFTIVRIENKLKK